MYNKRAWLNSSKSPSTGSVVCYCGPDVWEPSKISMFVEVSSCSSVSRLHHAGNERKQDFVNKIKKLRDELSLFIDFLDKD